ncbi:antizyme inhibitor 2-like isoform X2 [Ornithorhynchus anatinus]|uniref:antizyme inhibitor 2-like isoform X2 n=1 Tax=Ornithorhynchus anatinus TaxID=9258 RepID=UPI0010A76AE7|nr:antizyme inhibitor 2-like isoform X2 [Ornithorhynchus anatinus]
MAAVVFSSLGRARPSSLSWSQFPGTSPPGTVTAGREEGIAAGCEEKNGLILREEGVSALQFLQQKIQELSLSEQRDSFLVADLGELVRRHRGFLRALPRVTPFYAVKCNNSPWALQTLKNLGTGFDCASQGELEQVLELGVPAARIIYANPCKQTSHIQFAASHGVRLMTFDNEGELTKVAKFHPTASMVLRIKTEDSESLAQLSEKFGAPLESCPCLLEAARALGVAVVGVSFHVGSGCQNSQTFRRAIEDAHRVFEMGRQEGHEMRLLDIGGGFPGNESFVPTFEEMAEVINSSLDRHFPEGSGVELIAEPGKYYAMSVCRAAVNIIAKREVVEEGSKRFMYYMNNGVYGSFQSFALEKIEPKPIVMKKISSELPVYPCSLWGPTCDNLDKITQDDIPLPELDVGDWLMFENMGAYTVTLTSTFNGFPAPPVHNTVSRELSHWVM